MDPAPRSSFIPRQSTSLGTAAPMRRPRRVNFFNVIAFVIFLGSIILAGGTFGYTKLKENSLESKKQQLAEFRQRFQQGDMEAIERLHSHIQTVEALLASHIAPAQFFELLEADTQSEVQFTNFKFIRHPSGGVEVVLDGTAPRFNTVVLQAQRFAGGDIFSRAIFSAINKTEEDNGSETITFKVTGEIGANSLLFDPAVATEEPLEEMTTTVESTGDADETATSTDTEQEQ